MAPNPAGVALVTGAARGIGAATARALSAVGMDVVLADVLDGHEVARSIGSRASFEFLDVTSLDGWIDVVARTRHQYGPLRALINNAGVLGFGSVETLSPEQFRRVVEVNLVGPFLGMHCAAESLRESGAGVIVNVSSTAGLMGYQNLAGYVASKWGLRGLTKAAALDLSGGHIRVCSIHPGPIRTPMTAGMDEAIAAGQPIARFGSPDEVAAMIRFIVTEASYSTGAEFVVDGGAVTGSGIAVPMPVVAGHGH
ncbi:SDR family oxidoreductase [Gordonia sp. Z-3]|uniref:SDR family oxidoreductase n=1 Tax=Gordonia sp. Z-3 TaxID=3115408 RepID=UPI002E29C4DB|nr:SDR family oxidoreductase [Gordonia sp. Z-3]MED5800016.1 SDR family oxidoreductase [Gordonia sp. Z-3]